MRQSILQGWISGTLLVVIIYVVWFFAVYTNNESELLMWILWGAPLFAAILSSYLCPHEVIRLSVLITISTVFISISLNGLHQLFGRPSDFPGIEGAVILMFVTLIYGGILSFIGSMFGNFLKSRQLKHKV